jgi:hypothetical protein
MALYDHETNQNSSSPLVFLSGGTGMGSMWQPHFARLRDYFTQDLGPSRQAKEGKKVEVRWVVWFKEWLSIPRKPEPRMVGQCCNNASCATS